MNGEQLNLYEIEYEKYKITKPIRLITLFSGYDSQALALKYLDVPFEHYKTCEWSIKSMQALKDIHFTDKDIELNSNRTKQDMIDFLYQKGISSNWNEPMTKEQISRLSEEQLKTIIKNIAITHNLVNIQQVKGNDLEIVDTDKYTYVLTYSFPCQDLSLAGKGKGMSDTSTRSGMLWEVERILQECKDLGSLPEVLLMENVPQVHSQDNLQDFNKWKLRLEELGYNNYFQDLIATDYGIPQTRNRCFMVSILGDYSYTFPKPIPLKLKLKDMLEDNVDEKYYLSDKGMEYICGNAANPNLKDMYDRNNALLNRNNAYCLNTKIDRRAGDSNYILKDYGEISVKDFIKIKNATQKGYLEATDGDGIDISSRMEHHRGTVQKQKIQTLTTSGGNDLGVVVNMKTELCNNLIKQAKIKENDVIRHSYTNSRMNGEMKDLKQNNISPTLDTRCDCLGVCVGTYQYSKSDSFMKGKDRLQLGKETSDTLQTTQKEGVVINPLKGISGKSWQFEQQVYDENGSARTLKASEGSGNIPKVVNDLRIRKLTPKECFRLMGVKDEDYEKCAKNQSDSSLYHLAGDSIVVNVLMAIFKEMLGGDNNAL